MTLKPWLEQSVLRQMTGLPPGAFDTLTRALARICDAPYNRLHSMPAGDDPRERMAELSDSGFIIFTVDEAAGLIRVYDLVWTGLQTSHARLAQSVRADNIIHVMPPGDIR